MERVSQFFSPRALSYVILVLIVFLAIIFQLGSTILAGLFSYAILDAVHRRIGYMRPVFAKWLSLFIFIITLSAIIWMSGSFMRQSLTTIPTILEKAMPRFLEIMDKNGIVLPFENIEELKSVAITTLKENASYISRASGILTRGFFHVLVGIFISILCFLSEWQDPYGPNLYDAFRREMNERIWQFMQSFELVLGAQIIISAINTFFTAIFLFLLDFPHTGFLVPMTFFLGIMPIVGNLVSNTLITAAALTISPLHAIFALLFLVAIHKMEYFLNSKIIGSSIRVAMWQTLLAILIGEVMMGVPGIIIAPAVIHYIRREMSTVRYGECSREEKEWNN